MDHDYRRLLSAQKGLLTARQAMAFGIDDSAIHRRTRGERPRWRRVTPRVYATFVHPLTVQQQVIAGWLYAGDGAAITGAACLHWRGLPFLPREVTPLPVDMLIPAGRDCVSTSLVRAHRTRRMPPTVDFDHVRCVPVERAVADCARRLRPYSTVLALVTCAFNSGDVSADSLADELAEGPVKGSRHLRAALREASTDIRSVPEAELLGLIASAGLPSPLVNQPLVVNGQLFLPDLRWGTVIVEVNSRLHHVLRPGGLAATQKRQLTLEAAGYRVISVTPDQIRQQPALVVAAIVAALRASGAV